MTPILNDYSVAIVISKAGLNDAQLGTISERLARILKLLPEDGLLQVYLPGFAMESPEDTVDRGLRNVLERKGQRLCIKYIPMSGDKKAGVATAIVDAVEPRCDEIWCCPAAGQTAGSTARVAQVYRLGQLGPRFTRYKQIPPWVEPPAPPQQTKQPKKGQKSWRDMLNKQNFHW